MAAALDAVADALYAAHGGALTFHCGGQRGVDTWAAAAAERLRLPLHLYLPQPIPRFTAGWTPADVAALERSWAYASARQVVATEGGDEATAYTRRNQLLAEGATCSRRSGRESAVGARRKRSPWRGGSGNPCASTASPPRDACRSLGSGECSAARGWPLADLVAAPGLGVRGRGQVVAADVGEARRSAATRGGASSGAGSGAARTRGQVVATDAGEPRSGAGGGLGRHSLSPWSAPGPSD